MVVKIKLEIETEVEIKIEKIVASNRYIKTNDKSCRSF